MSKLKKFAFVVILIVAILVTYFFTKYSNESSSCDSNNKSTDLKPIISKKEIYRLPTNIKPLNYVIKVQPFMRPDQLYFNGSVLITVNCKESTNSIELNAKYLEINRDEIIIKNEDDNNDDSKIELTDFIYEDEVLKIKLKENLYEDDNYTIYIPFKGELTNNLIGFYRSSYLDLKTNETRYIAMTQFEPTDARLAFPCFDEPFLKATFDIEIVHLKNMTAISNMPVQSEHINGEYKTTIFKRTLKMSTYLVAYAVGDIKYIENKSKNKLEFKIYTRPSEINLAVDVLNYAPKILEHFENYFNIAYPLPKMDFLAAPSFGPNAMENWGLITFRESCILFDNKTNSIVDLYELISIVSHELSHQFFGDLVSPSNWHLIWLNEGFATYMSFEGVNAVRPDMESWKIFIIHKLQDVLGLDHLKASHQISFGPNDEALFDEISYSKGASVIRMLKYIVGADVFRYSLHDYLDKFKYSNTDQYDLWRSFQASSDKYNKNNKMNIKNIMSSWVLQKGYPLLTITRNYDDTNKVRFSQSKFELNENNKTKLIEIQFELPITYTFKSENDWNPKIKLWLHKTNNKSESFIEKQLNISENEWLIANLKQIGYYRVNYDERNWNLIIDQLIEDPSVIDEINRVQILDDLFNLAQNGMVDYKLALKALTYFKNEKDAFPWLSFSRHIDLINKMLFTSKYYGAWKQFINEFINSANKKINNYQIEGNEYSIQEMRELLINLAVDYNFDNFVNPLDILFQKFRINPLKNQIVAELRYATFCSAIHLGSDSEWNFIFDLYKKEQNSKQKLILLRSLSCTKLPNLLNQYLNSLLDENTGIKIQDGLLIFSNIVNKAYGKDIAFTFIRENWDSIYKIYSNNKLRLMIRSLNLLNTVTAKKEFKRFYDEQSKKSKIGNARIGFEQALEQIESNIIWMNKYEDRIGEYLKERNKN